MTDNPKSSPKQAPLWRIDLTEAPPSAVPTLVKLGFRQRVSDGVWSHPVWTQKQGDFLIRTVKALGCHGRSVSLPKEMRRQRTAVQHIEKVKAERTAARAEKRRRELERQAETTAQRDAYRRAEAVARTGLSIAGQ